MQKKVYFLIFFAIAIMSRFALVQAQELVPDILIVTFKEEIGSVSVQLEKGIASIGIRSIDALLSKYNVVHMERLFPGSSRPEPGSNLLDLTRYYRLRFSSQFSLQDVINEFKKNTFVGHVEPTAVMPIDASANDPQLNNQWAISKIQTPQAWDIAVGNTSILLAIIDTGIDWDHPDLAGVSPYTNGNIWINWSEYNGTSGVDDDNNGYIDDIRGWDWVTGETGWPGEDLDTPYNNPMDFHGHGTHVAGVAAAMTNNSVGVAGIAGGWYPSHRGVQIMSLRAGWKGTDGRGYVRMDFCAQAIEYARLKGATAINCSWASENWGGIDAAVTNAINAGIIVVKSAGNSNSETADYLNGRGDCLSVAATDQNDVKASFSNYGTWVKVSAPGANIRSTLFNDTYGDMSGTSMAAAHVSGLIGLVKTAQPSLSRSQIETTIRLSADNIDGQNHNYIGKLGSGRINANKAVRNLYVPQVYSTISSAISAAVSGQTVVVSGGTYTENLAMKTGVTVNGTGPGTTTINGTVTFDNDANASLTGSTVNGKITILSNSSGVTLSDITAGSSSCYLDITGQSAYVNNFNSNYNQSYSVWVNNASLFNMALGSLTNKGNALTVDYYTAGNTKSVIFCQNTRDILAGFSTGSVSAMECSFSSSTPGGSVQGNVTWDIWNYCGGSYSIILGKLSSSAVSSSDYDNALKNYVKIMNEIHKERKLKTEIDTKKYADVLLAVIKQFKEVIKNNSGSNEAKSSIGHIASIYRVLKEFTALEEFVKEMINDPKTKFLRFYALRVLVPSYINQNKFTRAIELTDQIINEYPNDSSVIEMIYSKGLVYKYYLKDEEKAKEMFDEVIRMDLEHVAAVFSRAELGTLGEEVRSNKLLSSEISKEIEIRNYPNPFNPTTTISYVIPSETRNLRDFSSTSSPRNDNVKVTLKVYDILGREIAELVNENKSSGTHEVKFDGSNLPSGIYFYSINHGKQRLSGKMLLLK